MKPSSSSRSVLPFHLAENSMISNNTSPKSPKNLTNEPRTTSVHDDKGSMESTTANTTGNTGSGSPLTEASGVKKKRNRPSLNQRKAQKALAARSSPIILPDRSAPQEDPQIQIFTRSSSGVVLPLVGKEKDNFHVEDVNGAFTIHGPWKKVIIER